MTDIQNETSGETGRHQWHKGPRLCGAAMSWKQEDNWQNLQKDSGQETMEFEKQVVRIPIRLRKVWDRTLCRGQSPPKQENILHTG
jgi:hypothetical protein